MLVVVNTLQPAKPLDIDLVRLVERNLLPRIPRPAAFR